MPKTSIAVQQTAEFALPARPMEPPVGLSEEEAGYLRGLVGQFPRERFDVDDVPLLVELVRHQATARLTVRLRNSHTPRRSRAR